MAAFISTRWKSARRLAQSTTLREEARAPIDREVLDCASPLALLHRRPCANNLHHSSEHSKSFAIHRASDDLSL
jgi:hypothetical protein